MANAETCSFDSSLDDLNDIDFSDIDSSFVMSLLEDSQVLEGTDDERLRSVIQSLEAEIMNQDSFLQTNSDDYQFSDADQIESCSTSPDRIYFEGFDEGLMPYVISDYADDIDNVVEFVGKGDYSEICYGMCMEDNNYHVLWQ